jgi:hypothetical protein
MSHVRPSVVAFPTGKAFVAVDRELGKAATIIRSIESNPVSAGLVTKSEDWVYSSFYAAGREACPTVRKYA